MLVKPAAPRPMSAGIQPELDCKLLNRIYVEIRERAPPISGSLTSAPSIAKTAHAALSVDGKLLGKIRLPVHVGHSARC